MPTNKSRSESFDTTTSTHRSSEKTIWVADMTLNETMRRVEKMRMLDSSMSRFCRSGDVVPCAILGAILGTTHRYGLWRNTSSDVDCKYDMVVAFCRYKYNHLIDATRFLTTHIMANLVKRTLLRTVANQHHHQDHPVNRILLRELVERSDSLSAGAVVLRQTAREYQRVADESVRTAMLLKTEKDDRRVLKWLERRTGSLETSERTTRVLETVRELLPSRGESLYWFATAQYAEIEAYAMKEAVDAEIEASDCRKIFPPSSPYPRVI